MIKSASLALLAAVGHITTSSAACNRATLKATADAFFNTAISKSGASSLKLSPTVKIVENNVKHSSLQDTAHAYIAAFARPFRLDAIDTQTCNVASFVVVNMTEQDPAGGKGTPPITDCKGFGQPTTGKTSGKTSGKSSGKSGMGNLFGSDQTAPTSGKNPWPNIISLRAQISEASGEINEIEIVNIGTGKGGNAGTMMQSAAMPQNPSALWSEPLRKTTATGGPALSRDDLVKILDTYPEGIHRHNGSGVKSAKTCGRIENGRRMPFACNDKYEGLTQNVTNRDWVVDTETGISLGKFFFERPFSPFWIHEFFKITDGYIQEIYAAIMPWGCSSFQDMLKY